MALLRGFGNGVLDVLIERLKPIRLFAMDVDGVLTNGDIIYPLHGEEIKVFNVKDGHGLAMLSHKGLHLAVITGRNSPITQRRADELGIQHVFQGVKTKLPVLQGLVADLGLGLDQVAYMGDDTPDLPVLEAVGFCACPSDAVDVVRDACHWVSDYPGGRGAVRELADLLLAYADGLQVGA